MKPEPNNKLDAYRNKYPPSKDGASYGDFTIKVDRFELHVISSGSHEDSDWEHVSVSLKHRCPRWGEMCIVKDMFWDEEETVVQFHPRQSDYVNLHPFVLHMWKQRGVSYGLPPQIYI